MEVRTRHARAAGFGPSVAAMRRRMIYRPLAALMALLLTPVASLAGGITAAPAPVAGAVQVSGCFADPSSPAIIRQYCVDGISYGPDLTQLERDAVAAYLGEHGMPAEDAHVIYDYGRTDLRSGVRANMIMLLQGIIMKPASDRTVHEQNLYNWLSALVHKNEIALYTHALTQYAAWQADPCRFTLDPTIASVYNLSYDGAIFCGSPLNSLFGGPPVPAESYFTAYGMRKSYAAVSDTYPQFSALVAQTGINIGVVAGIAAAAFTLVAAAATVALVVNLTVALQSGLLAFKAAVVVSGSTVASLGTASLAAGPAAIVLIAIAIGVTAGMQTFERQAILDNLNNLSALLAKAQSAPPDLQAFVNDTSGLGGYKIQMTVVSQTVPDVPSTNALPQHQSTDLNFAIGPDGTLGNAAVGDTLVYEDWDGNDWTAKTWGGWFVKTCSGATCGQTESISGSLAYVDWSGVKWTASRFGDRLISTKAAPADDDVACPADNTGVSPGTDFSHCSNYVSTSIPLKDGGGNPVRVSLSARSAPVFGEIVSLPFNPGFASSRTITATGNPTPQICYAAGSLPAHFSLNGGACGQGTFQITYDGSTQEQGRYPLTLVATNGVGSPVTKQFTVDFSPQLAITSPNTLAINAGFPVRFTVSATGNPTPTLSPNPLLNLSSWDLTFTDNGDGTATISGTPQRSVGIGACFYPEKVPCGIIASNSQGTVEQQLNFTVSDAPSARLVPPATAQFLAGVPNQVVLRTDGAVTPVTITLVPNAVDPQPPAWLTVQDLGDGTAVLSGTPPLGTTGRFGLKLSTIAVGSLETFQPRPFDYEVNVTDQPAFTSPNIATFTAGTSGDFDVTANQGTITLSGALPRGLTFIAGNPASISGTPAADSSGSYTIALTTDAGALGSAQQSLQLNVYAPPRITSENTATFISGAPGMFAVTTTGFPSISTLPVPASYSPPTDPSQGLGTYFTVTGLPGGLQFSNLNAHNFATGTLIIEGTSTATGTYPVTITAANGVGAPAQQTLMLQIIGLTGAAPASGTTCNGNYNGTFIGNVTVTAGQNCSLIGGRIEGNILLSGGSLSITNTEVTGNVSIQGNAAFSIGERTHILGSLAIQNVSSAVSTNRVCGATIGTNMSLLANATAIAVGSPDIVSCSGNQVGGNLTIKDNTGTTTVYNNFMNKNLGCTSNVSITGAGNAANKKNGQCSAF